MILELPLPSPTSSPRRSSIFLQPSVYVPPDSKRVSDSASASVSVFSDEDSADLLVAEKITYMEPNSRPNIILISPFTRSEVPVSRETKRAYRNSSINSEGNVEIPSRSDMDVDGDRLVGIDETDSKHLRVNTGTSPRISMATPDPDIEMSPKSTLSTPVPVPAPTSTPSIQRTTRPNSFSRPIPPSSLSIPHQPRNSTRPVSSSRSLSSTSIARYTTTPPISSSSQQGPYYSSASFYRDRTGSSYSTASSRLAGAQFSFPFPKNQALKHSAASSISTSSSVRSRSEAGAEAEADSASVYTADWEEEKTATSGLRTKVSRRGLRRRSEKDKEKEKGKDGGGSPSPSSPLKRGMGIMGLKLGRKATVK